MIHMGNFVAHLHQSVQEVYQFCPTQFSPVSSTADQAVLAFRKRVSRDGGSCAAKATRTSSSVHTCWQRVKAKLLRIAH
eukprot:6213337-Pleurochrysis_carterae.AAC.5